MKTLTQLALVSAMVLSSSAFAMQSLDDSELSSTTGQDGITIVLGTATDGIVADAIVVHDNDGVGSGNFGVTTSSAGAIVLGKQGVANSSTAGSDFSITGGDITVKVDADGNAGKPVLNVNVGLPTALSIKTGDIYVAESGGIAAAAAGQYTQGTAAKILDSVEIALSGAKLNIQLGNAPQGAMMKLSGTIGGGLQINNLSLYQPTTTTAVTGATIGTAGIHLGGINIKTAGNASDWILTGNINATDAGLQVSGLGSVDLRLTNVDLGTKQIAAVKTNRIGDVALLGLALPNVTIGGH